MGRTRSRAARERHVNSMSHFTTLVIGDDVESALAPYHEYECAELIDSLPDDTLLTVVDCHI
jgi:IMP cyclohydrolase